LMRSILLAEKKTTGDQQVILQGKKRQIYL